MDGRTRITGLALLFAAAVGSGCGDGTGVVELAWVFVDRNGDSIYPGGALAIDTRPDSCDFAGRMGGTTLDVDLRVQLEICDPRCAGGCDDPACQVIDPLLFPCNTWRGSDPNIPAGDEPYRFTVRAVIDAPQAGLACETPAPTCIAVPGPRDRTVKPGLVTDLQVVQIVVDMERTVDEALDLTECGCA